MKKVLVLAMMMFGLQVFADEWCVGDIAVRTTSNGSHYDIKIERIYADGTVLVSYAAGYSNETVRITELSRPLQRLNQFYVGQNAVRTTSNGSHYNVTIKKLYADYTVLVSYAAGYSDEVVKIAELSTVVRRAYGIRVGDEMVRITSNGSHYDVTVKQIYPDRKALVSYAAGYSDEVINVSELSRHLEYSLGFTVGDNVVRTTSNGSHYDVTIKKLYADRKALVSYAAGYSDEVVSIDELTQQIGCTTSSGSRCR